MEDHQRHAAWLLRAGLVTLTLVSSAVVAVRRAAVAFVVGSYVTLLLLLACLRAYERAPPPGSPAREPVIKAAVAVALGAMGCETALAVHDARGGGMASAAFALVAYAALLALICLLIREVAGRTRGALHGHGHEHGGRGAGAVEVEDAAHQDVLLEDGVV